MIFRRDKRFQIEFYNFIYVAYSYILCFESKDNLYHL